MIVTLKSLVTINETYLERDLPLKTLIPKKHSEENKKESRLTVRRPTCAGAARLECGPRRDSE